MTTYVDNLSATISSLKKEYGYIPHVRHVFNVKIGVDKPSKRAYNSPEFKKLKREYFKLIQKEKMI